MQKLSDLINSKDIILLDSAMGTELMSRGANVTLPLWSAHSIIDSPEIIKAIHVENIDAGADIITTNTFRTQRITFEKAGYRYEGKSFSETAFEFTRRAVEIAKEAVKESGKNVLVAGGISPLEDCYKPELVPDTDTLSTEHYEHIKNLVNSGIDFLLAETMNSIKEISSVLNQMHQTGYEYCISFVPKNEVELFSNETIKDAMKIIDKFDPKVVMINCIHPELSEKVISKLRSLTDKPLLVFIVILATLNYLARTVSKLM